MTMSEPYSRHRHSDTHTCGTLTPNCRFLTVRWTCSPGWMDPLRTRGQLFAPTIAADPPAAPRELSLEEAAIYPCKVANQGTACYLLYRALARWYVNPRTAGVLREIATSGKRRSIGRGKFYKKYLDHFSISSNLRSQGLKEGQILSKSGHFHKFAIISITILASRIIRQPNDSSGSPLSICALRLAVSLIL